MSDMLDKPNTVEIAGRRVRIVRRLPLIYEDLRPGREGRRAPMTLVKRPSVERLRELFDYEPDTGVLRWRVSPARNVKAGDEAGTILKGCRTSYHTTRITGVLYLNHVLVWTIVKGEWPDRDLDHIDGDGLNYRIENLREATASQNQHNTHGAQRGSSSSFKGVSWHKFVGKWCAQIRCGEQEVLAGRRRKIHLGLYTDERTAALMYDRAAQIAFGPFACLNFAASESADVILPIRSLADIREVRTAQRAYRNATCDVFGED